MSEMTLILQDATRSETIKAVTSFVGEDATGSFGLLPGHARFITTLIIGLARFKKAGSGWTYIAMPGAVLYFKDNVLTISSRRFFIDEDYMRISQTLDKELVSEEEKLFVMKESLHHMEEEVLKRLWELGRTTPG